MRLFLAVDPGPELLQALGECVVTPGARAEEQARARYRWVRPESCHLTLKFLGSVEPARLSELDAVAREAIAGVEPFSIELTGYGAFPSEASPRVLWLGVRDPARGLSRLAECLEQGFAPLGFAVENREFTPHLTLARLLSGRPWGGWMAWAREELPASLGTSRVSQVTLYQSTTLPSGAIYEALRRWELLDAR